MFEDLEIPKTPVSELDEAQLNEISELSKRGYQLLKEGLTERAVSCFKEILEIDDNNNYALVGLGDTFRKDRKYRDAINYYQKCLDLHGGNNYALFGLADCFKALKQFNRAIDIWEEYLKHDDKNITVLTRIADAYRKVRNFRKSNEIYLKVLDMQPHNSYALIGLGHLHYDFKEYTSALKYWERMYNLNEDNVDIRVLTSLGNCHRKLKTYEDGVKYFENALQIEPNNFYALFGLADCFRGLNKPEKSLKHWLKILERDPRNKVILTRAGDAFRHMGELGDAERYYRKALNIEFDVYAIIGLALINKEEGNYEEAISSLVDLVYNEPKNYRLYIEIAECYEAKKEIGKAIEALNQFQKLGIRNSHVSDYLMELRHKL